LVSFRPVERVGEHEIGSGDPVAADELMAGEMRLDHRDHVPEVLAREHHVTRDAPRFGKHRGVLGDSPQRLLELGHREEEPAIHLGAALRVRGEEALLWILLGQIEDDGDGLVQDQVAVDQHRHLSRRVELQELTVPVLALDKIDPDGLERHLQLLQHPTRADRTGRGEFVELHRCLLTSTTFEQSGFRQRGGSER
jgi:hypothetical protein